MIGLGIDIVLVGGDNQWYISTMTGCCARSTVGLQTRPPEWSFVHDLVLWCSSVQRGLVCTLLFHPQPGRGSSSSSSNTQPSADAIHDTLRSERPTCHTAWERCRRSSAAFSILPVPSFNLTTQLRERHPLGGPLSEGRRRRQRRHLHTGLHTFHSLD
jgi:hypothetical protein